MSVIPPSRMTKPQLLEELAKLKDRGTEIVSMEKEVEQKATKTLFEKSEKDFTKQALVRSFGEARAAVGEELEKLLERALAESVVLEELRNTIALSRKELELAHGKEVVARALAELVAEYEEKRRQGEAEISSSVALHEANKRSREESWKREQEEYEYAKKRDRARDAESWKEVAEKRELVLLEREDAWKEKEARFAEMGKMIDKTPKDIEKAVSDREVELSKRLDAEHGQVLTSAKKEWEAEKAILELRLANLADQLKKQTNETASMRADLERATTKAQELALAVIAGGKQSLPPTTAIEQGK